MKLLCNGDDISQYIVDKIEISFEFEESKLVGNTVSKEMKISLDNYGRRFKDLSSDFILSSDNYIFGVYHVYDAPQNTSEILKLTLYDNMLKLDVNYNSTLAYPVKLKEQLDEIMIMSGITIIYDNIPEYVLNKDVGWYDNTCTMREHIGWIAELCGMNAMCTCDGDIIFYSLSTKTELYSGIVETYKKKESCIISRICFDNGLLKYEKGSHRYNTLYLSNDNLYIDDQIYIDAIFELYNGVEFTSVEKIKMSAIDDLQLGHVVRFIGHFSFMPTKIKWVWEGGSYAIQTISGTMPSKASEIVEQKISEAAKIRIIKTTVDQVAGEMSIVSKEIDDLNENYAQLVIKSDSIQTQVSKLGQSIYRFEAGSGNLFLNCEQSLSKQKGDDRVLLSMDMPPYIDADFLSGKDICISVDIEAIQAVPKSLDGYVSAYFSVSYDDGTSERFALQFIPGVFTVGSSLALGQLDINKRLYRTFKVKSKAVTKISNLSITINCNADFVYIGFPKVEIGTKPTGFYYDLQEIKDNIITIEKQYSEINQQIDSLSLSVTSATEEITTIKGEVIEQETRLQNAELKLTPTSIVQAVNEKIGVNGELVTNSTILDKKGFHVIGAGFDVTNLENKKVFDLDSNGNIVLNDITAKNANLSGVFANRIGKKYLNISEAEIKFYQQDSQGRDIPTVVINNERLDLNSASGLPVASIYNQNNMMCLSNGLGNIAVLGSLFFNANINSPSISERDGIVTVKGTGSGGFNIYVGSTCLAAFYNGQINLNASTFVNSHFTVTGQKNRAVAIDGEEYILMNAVESADAVFEDFGDGILNDAGDCYVKLNTDFLLTVNTNSKYYVFLTKTGIGDVYVSSKNQDGFIVKGTPGLSFDWRVTIRQKGYENTRMKRIKRGDHYGS